MSAASHLTHQHHRSIGPGFQESQITFPAKLKRALARGKCCALAKRRLLRLSGNQVPRV
jgi:hypothetical protein